MKGKKILCLAASAFTFFMNSCNSTNDVDIDMSGFTDALIQSFVLQNNDSVAANLEDVYFTINQYGSTLESSNPFQEITGDAQVGQIFNADSLPVGSVPDSIRFSLSLTSVESVKIYTETDTTDYDESIYFDFTSPALMEIVAGNGETTKYYEVKVNVHQLVGDSIAWQENSTALLSGVSGTVTAQSTIGFGDDVLYYLNANGAIQLAKASNTDLTNFEISSVSTATLDINNIVVYNNMLYATDEAGTLLTSTDGANWSSTSTSDITALIGVYEGKQTENELVAIQSISGKNTFVYSLDGSTWRTGDTIPASFPISGFSNAELYSAGSTNRMTIVGGETAAGELTSSFWSYERTALPGQDTIDVWQAFSQELDGFVNATLVPYTDQYGALALGGNLNEFWLVLIGSEASDAINNTIYITPNRGVGITEAIASYQLPETFEARSNPSVYVDPQLNIYLLGGFQQGGAWLNELWKGRLNQVTFAPLQ